MSLSSKVKNRIVDAIHVTFDAIGHKTITIGETKQNSTMPKSTSNHASLVWEYVVAKDLLSRAEKRRKAAEKELMDAGLIPNPIVNPRGVGKYDTVCSTDFAAITLEVRVGRKMVDVDEFAAFLKKKGVKPALVDEARAFATTTAKSAYYYSPVWLTSDDNGK